MNSFDFMDMEIKPSEQLLVNIEELVGEIRRGFELTKNYNEGVFSFLYNKLGIDFSEDSNDLKKRFNRFNMLVDFAKIDLYVKFTLDLLFTHHRNKVKDYLLSGVVVDEVEVPRLELGDTKRFDRVLDRSLVFGQINLLQLLLNGGSVRVGDDTLIPYRVHKDLTDKQRLCVAIQLLSEPSYEDWLYLNK